MYWGGGGGYGMAPPSNYFQNPPYTSFASTIYCQNVRICNGHACLPVLYEMFRRADTGVCVVMFARCLEGLIQEYVL